MFLLDAPIVLELRRAKAGRTDPGLIKWAKATPAQNLYISALTLLEIETGIEKVERRDRTGGAALQAWLDSQVMAAFAGRILPLDAAVARRRAKLPYGDSRNGVLAATALEHGLTLATREVETFRAGRVKTFNPWGYAPVAEDEDGDWRQAARSGPMWLKNLFIRS